MSLTYSIEPGGPSVILSDEAIASMVRNRQMTIRDSEAGGQLFAKFDGSKTIVVEATGPKPLDKRSRFGFIPSRWLERLEIRAQYKMGKHFVGDWHTHPQPIPSPSSEDISSMIDCFSKSHHELKAFLMVIVGTANLPEGILVCVVDTHGVKPLEHQP